MRRLLLAAAVLLAALITIQPAFAQRDSVQKWDVYGGYSYLNTPTNDLSQNGYNFSFGRNINRWLALGLDFSHFNGSGSQAQALPAPLSGSLQVPFDASTSTFAAGTQFQVRKTKWVTPFFRPFLGAFHSSAEAKVNEIKLPAGVPPALLAAIPSSELKRSETVLGYGAGAGVDFNISKPIGIRFATDYIRTGLFDQKQNNVRIAFGLIYRFGGEIRSK
jgi:opacity protein-like surface antigen